MTFNVSKYNHSTVTPGYLHPKPPADDFACVCTGCRANIDKLSFKEQREREDTSCVDIRDVSLDISRQ